MLEHERTIGQTYFLVNPQPLEWTDIHRVAMDALGREVEQVVVSAEMLYELDPKRFLMVPGVFAKNLLCSAAKLQRDVPEFRPTISLHDGLADAFEYLESHALVEDVPLGDWEDRIIEVQLDARARILARSGAERTASRRGIRDEAQIAHGPPREATRPDDGPANDRRSHQLSLRGCSRATAGTGDLPGDPAPRG